MLIVSRKDRMYTCDKKRLLQLKDEIVLYVSISLHVIAFTMIRNTEYRL